MYSRRSLSGTCREDLFGPILLFGQCSTQCSTVGLHNENQIASAALFETSCIGKKFTEVVMLYFQNFFKRYAILRLKFIKLLKTSLEACDFKTRAMKILENRNIRIDLECIPVNLEIRGHLSN